MFLLHKSGMSIEQRRRVRLIQQIFYWGSPFCNEFSFKTLTLFNSTPKTGTNALFSCPVLVLVILMLADLLSIKPIFFSKPLMNGPIFNRYILGR